MTTAAPQDAWVEAVHLFECAGEQLVGIVHAPTNARIGVVFVPGGGQYRVGSHRLFVQLARALATQGFAALRFDHRGVGDSGGRFAGFQHLQADLEAAVATFRESCPTIERIVLLGVCDGAAAAVLAVAALPQVAGLALINPWVHSSELEARTRFSSYYRERIRSRDFWRKALRGQIDVVASGRSLFGYLLDLRSVARRRQVGSDAADYVTRMFDNLDGYGGRVAVVLSGKDLVAQQFRQLLARDETWKALTEREGMTVMEFAEADHTFSYRVLREALEQRLVQWLSTTFSR